MLVDMLGSQYEDDPDIHAASMATAQGRFPEPNGMSNPLLKLGDAAAGLVGLSPRTDERVGDFWSRQFPRSTPPGMKEPMGRDIELPDDREPVRKRKSLKK